MNLPLWSAIREYIDAEIKLAFARYHADLTGYRTKSESQRIEALEAQSTRMETAVREML